MRKKNPMENAERNTTPKKKLSIDIFIVVIVVQTLQIGNLHYKHKPTKCVEPEKKRNIIKKEQNINKRMAKQINEQTNAN